MTVYYVILRIIWRFFGLKRDYGESLVYGIIRAKWQNNAVYGSPGGKAIGAGVSSLRYDTDYGSYYDLGMWQIPNLSQIIELGHD